jgi:hypothetical protein
MLLIRGDDEAERSPAEMQGIVEEYMAWARQLRSEGRMLGGDELSANGRLVRGHGASATVSDGPFTETKEAIGGYFLIEADGESQAVDIARACPGLKRGGAVEVRAIVDHS